VASLDVRRNDLAKSLGVVVAEIDGGFLALEGERESVRGFA
jgi:hypothetical protein